MGRRRRRESFVPLIANIQAHEGDFVITDCGIVVPSYANLQVFRGYHAREAHELFQNILRSLGHLEPSHPCLFEDTRHGLLVAQILYLILEIADPDDHGAGSVLDLAWVVQNIKLAAPLSSLFNISWRQRRQRLPSCLSFRLRGTSLT